MGVRGMAGQGNSLSVFDALAWLLFGLGVVLVMVAVLLPPQMLVWLRSDFHFFGQTLNWLEHSSPHFELTHVILFVWLGLLSSWLWRRLPWWQVALALAALAIATELMQFLAPGRNPRFSDIYDDVLGVVIGLGLAIPLRWYASARASRAPHRQ